jgi:hypothetical protein
MKQQAERSFVNPKSCHLIFFVVLLFGLSACELRSNTELYRLSRVKASYFPYPIWLVKRGGIEGIVIGELHNTLPSNFKPPPWFNDSVKSSKLVIENQNVKDEDDLLSLGDGYSDQLRPEVENLVRDVVTTQVSQSNQLLRGRESSKLPLLLTSGIIYNVGMMKDNPDISYFKSRKSTSGLSEIARSLNPLTIVEIGEKKAQRVANNRCINENRVPELFHAAFASSENKRLKRLMTVDRFEAIENYDAEGLQNLMEEALRIDKFENLAQYCFWSPHNKLWAEKIASFVDADRFVFIVGISHTVSIGSVLEQLQMQRFTVNRVRPEEFLGQQALKNFTQQGRN